MNAVIQQKAEDGIFLMEEAIIDAMTARIPTHTCTKARTLSLEIGGTEEASPHDLELITFFLLERMRSQGRVNICPLPDCDGWNLTKQEKSRRLAPPQLSQDLDWATDITVEEYPQNGDVLIRNIDWIPALYHHSPSIQEALENPTWHYVTTLDGHVPVGYSFEFNEHHGHITAYGHLHPAVIYPDASSRCDATTNIVQAKIAISFRSIRTREAVRRYISHHRGQPETI